MATTLDPDSLRASVEAARSESQRGRPARAVTRYRTLRTLIERSGDTSAEVGAQRCRVLLGLAAAEFEVSGDLDAAVGLLSEAESEATRSGASLMVAPIRGQRGLLLLRIGRRQDALSAFDAAADVRHAADRYDHMSILLNRGVLHLDIGSLDQAVRDFEEALDLAERSGDAMLAWKARHNLGFAHFLAGRIPRALAAMEEAERRLGVEVHPIGLLDRARVLRAAGLTDDAARILDQVAESLRTARLHQDVGETDLVRAECSLVGGDQQRALRLARGAERLFARRGNLPWLRKAELMVLQCERRVVDGRSTRTRRSTLRRLAARARSLAETCRAEGRRDLARQADLVALEALLRAGGDPREVAATVPRVRVGDSLPSRLLTREVRALAAMNRGEGARAAAEVRRGLDELGSHVRGFGSLDLRTAGAVHGVPLARIGLELAERNGSPAEFFAAVERGRAISISLASVGPPKDQQTADLLGALRQAEEEARGLEADPDAEEQRARLRARATTLQRDIRARAWELEGGSEPTVDDGVRVSRVRAAASAQGVEFASFIVHRGRWTAVLASGHRARQFDLADAREVDELVRRVRADLEALAMPFLPAPLADSVRGSLDAGLDRLDRLLLGPLGVRGVPLVVSGSSGLTLLPWSLLPSRRGVPVVVTPSAAAWLRGSAAPRASDPRVVSVAGPGLHRAEAEARGVQGCWPHAELLVGPSATTDALRGALSEADVVHVAAHGSHQHDSPLFSSVRVQDGPLFAYELDAEDEPAPCVVLSACEAGLATVRPGDEGLGLTSVLLHLGSRSVLASVARVRDDVAARVMGDVHAAMSGGTDSARALAEALDREEQPAPFVAFGATW